jgi:outer membrane protein OmpA-like peptidoglycan-associated protein
MVGAVNEPEGDYEAITTIVSVDDGAVDVNYSTQVKVGQSIRNVNVPRKLLIRDLKSARLVNYWFSSNSPRSIPGTTAFGPSATVLHALKTRGEAELGIVDRGSSTLTADRNIHPNIFDYEIVFRMRRVGNAPVLLPIIVNDAKVSVPAIRARGEHMGDRIEFFFLDDLANPIALEGRWSNVSNSATMTTRVVKISYHCSGSPRAFALSDLEKSLIEKRRADVYQLYFDFNSDRLRKESDPTLTEIAAVLRCHSDWNLFIEGHTDNIGGESYNLDLSRRRAAAVKTALVNNFRIDPRRLTHGGAGASRPKDTNATLEGRARNRRVELVRG